MSNQETIDSEAFLTCACGDQSKRVVVRRLVDAHPGSSVGRLKTY